MFIERRCFSTSVIEALESCRWNPVKKKPARVTSKLDERRGERRVNLLLVKSYGKVRVTLNELVPYR